MSEEKKEEIKKEEGLLKENLKEETKNDNQTRRGKSNGRGGNSKSGNGRSGGESTRSGTGTETGTTGETSARIEKGTGGDKQERKQSIIQNIRSKRSEGNPTTSDTEHSNTKGTASKLGGSSDGTDNGNGSFDRSNTRTVDNDSEHGRPFGIGDSDTDGNSTSTKTNSRVKKEQTKASFDLNSLKKIGKDTQKVTDATPKLEKELTKKEGTELQPRVEAALKIAFTYADKGIYATIREKKEIVIWSSINDEEIKVIATYLIEGGQRSQLLATATRQISRDYQKLQMGLIMIPRLYQTVQVYMSQGFMLGMGQTQGGYVE